MWMLESAFYLAIAHIAGDNIAVVPDMAAVLGCDIYVTVILAYIVLGSIIAGILAWIGISTGYELNKVVSNLFGLRGKQFLALITLFVCIPASSLTGGYFTGSLIHNIFGLPIYIAIPFCLFIFSLFSTGFGENFLKLTNYLGLLIIPMVLLLLLLNENTFRPFVYTFNHIDWVLVIALVGYNIGGMRSLLVVETSACLLKKGNKAIYLSVLAKLLEGLFTLSLAYLTMITNTDGPLALLGTAQKTFSLTGSYMFAIILLCIFINTMAPAMMVNAKQISILTKLPFETSLFLAVGLVWLLSFIYYYNLLLMISMGTISLIVLMIFTVYNLHKQRTNKQK
jgi:hypothetical protein